MNTTVMLSGHQTQTLERARISEGDYILAVQDTTYYNYSGHKAKAGLGRLQGKVRGLLQHNVMLLSETGIPLGILDQQYWTRDGGQDLSQKESGKWMKGLEAINICAPLLNQRLVAIQDREADIFDFLKAERATNVDLLVRVYENRRMELVESGLIAPLSQIPAFLPECGTYSLLIYQNHKEVEVTVKVQAAAVRIHPRKDLSIAKHQLTHLSLVVAQVVRCVAVDSQQELPCGAVWQLLTTLPIDTFAQVAKVVHFYAIGAKLGLGAQLCTQSLSDSRLSYGSSSTSGWL